jgi:hypothetical protein
MHSAIEIKHCENKDIFFFNGNIILGLRHSSRGFQVPPSDSATDMFLPQFSQLPEKVRVIDSKI